MRSVEWAVVGLPVVLAAVVLVDRRARQRRAFGLVRVRLRVSAGEEARRRVGPSGSDGGGRWRRVALAVGAGAARRCCSAAP